MNLDAYLRLDQVKIAGLTGNQIVGYSHVLAAHNITTPKQLNERLGRKAPERRVKVFDAVNRERLLGTITVPGTPAHGRIRIASYPPVETIRGCMSYERVAEMKFSSVELEVTTRTDPNAWTSEIALVTYDPLSLLMQMRGFRLPGETEAQAEDRRWRS